MGTFNEDVSVAEVGPGRYRCDLSHDWDLVAVPQGGVVASVALRAATEAVGATGQQLRSCTTVFVEQVSAGRLEITTEVLRRGRTATQVRATVRNEGSEAGATVLAVFGSSRSGPTFVDVVAPEVSAPAGCPSFRDAPPPGAEPVSRLPFWDHVEGRPALGHAPWEDYQPVRSDVATWLRFDEPPRRADGSLDPLGLVTLCDSMPSAVRERLGWEGRRWFAPSADLTVHFFEPLHSEWVLAHDRARWSDDGWASAECFLWDEQATLVAYATQMMLFTYLPE